VLPLLLLSAAFSYAVFQKGGVWSQDWNIFLLILGLLALFYRPRTPVPRLEPWLRWPLILLPCYAAFQLLPLPIPLLRILSPARAEIQAALGGSFAPLSVVPVATLHHFIRISACVAAFLLLRQLAHRFSGRPWTLAYPIILIASLEAALGLAQQPEAHGTYVSRNHYAGLLEMSLGFPVAYALACGSNLLVGALTACASLSAAALILLAIIHSQSRMGFIAALFSLFVMALLALPFRKWTALALAAALVLLAFIYLPPDQLIARFADLASTDEISGDTRAHIWSDTLRLIAAYPVFGCGLGGYHSAFLRYKQVAPASTVDFAHNDYLQFLAELGIIGFAIAAALILSVLFLTLRALSKHTTRQGRALALASIGGLAAILLHSLVDFNLYVPANALLMTWIAALAATLMFSSRPLPAPRVIEVKAVATG